MTVSFVKKEEDPNDLLFFILICLLINPFPLRLREAFLNSDEYGEMLEYWSMWPPFNYFVRGLDLEGVDYKTNNTRLRKEFLKRITSEENKAQYEDFLKQAIRRLPESTRTDILWEFKKADRDPLMLLNSIGVSPFDLLNILMDAFDAQVGKRGNETIFNQLEIDGNNDAEQMKKAFIIWRRCWPLIRTEEISRYLPNPETFEACGKIISDMAEGKYLTEITGLRPKEPGKKRRLPKADLRRKTVAELFQECMAEDLGYPPEKRTFLSFPCKEKVVRACICCLIKAAFPKWYPHDLKNLLRQVKEDSGVKVVYNWESFRRSLPV